jgi:hypothetical protein
VPDGENAAIEAHEPPRGHTPCQRAAGEPDRSELPVRDHPMLPRSNTGEPRIRGWLSWMLVCGIAGNHPMSLAREVSPVGDVCYGRATKLTRSPVATIVAKRSAS